MMMDDMMIWGDEMWWIDIIDIIDIIDDDDDDDGLSYQSICTKDRIQVFYTPEN